jgi:hypothetical protein
MRPLTKGEVMSDDPKAIANEHFEFVKRCYPDALAGLNVTDSPTVYRTYLYGVMKAVFANREMDQFVKMYLLTTLKNEIGMTADDLAAEILKYSAGLED